MHSGFVLRDGAGPEVAWDILLKDHLNRGLITR